MQATFLCILWNIKKHNLECFTDELTIHSLMLHRWLFIHQYDSQNVRKTVEMVTEPCSKHNDCNTNLSLLTENSGEGREYNKEQYSTIQNSSVQYRIKLRTVQYNTMYLNKIKWHNVLLITKASKVYSNKHLLSQTHPF